MSGQVTRRAFLFGALGAVAAGWVWFRERGVATQAAQPTATTATSTPPSTSTTAAATTSTATSASPTSTSTTSTVPSAPRIDALCRDAWRAAAPSGAFTDHTIDRMTVHHTARELTSNRNAPAAILSHQRFHQLDRGWPDIAYHFLVDLDGNVYEGRPVGAVGDTATNYDPTGHFLVACEGDFNLQALPDAQRDALIAVLAWAAAEFDTAPGTIRGHRDVAATTCPGDNLYPLISQGDLAAAVEERLAAGGVELEVVCGDVAADRINSIEA